MHENDHPDIFISMCKRLTNVVKNGEDIDEVQLFDFSRLVIRKISNLPDELPDEYLDLKDAIAEYWLYDLNSGTINHAYLPYIRLFQLVNIISIAYAEKMVLEVIENLKIDLSPFECRLIHEIYFHPGITCNSLNKITSNSIKDILDATSKLADKGVLILRRTGKQQYYMLSNLGEQFYHVWKQDH